MNELALTVIALLLLQFTDGARPQTGFQSAEATIVHSLPEFGIRSGAR